MVVERISPIGEDHTSSSACGDRPAPPTIEKVFAMGKGDGEHSYDRNSVAQAQVVSEFAFPYLTSALERVNLSGAGPIILADLGCSSGQNTINHLSFIVDKLSSRIKSVAASSSLVPEFQAFFSDLSSNDFNNLFQLLSKDPRAGSGSESQFFVAGVPGSFYGRLFCCSSVHVFFSASSVHWLSKVPDVVLDKESPAFNRGSIWIENSAPEVGKAYQEQAVSDMKVFLQVRAAELVPGGLLFFTCTGRPSDDLRQEVDPNLLLLMDDVLTALIEEGVLTNDQRDTLNIPFYGYTREDIAQAIQSVESSFEVVTNSLDGSKINLLSIWPNSDPSKLARQVTGSGRAIVGVLMEAHIGKEAADLFWQRYEGKVRDICPQLIRNPEIGKRYFHHVALVRK